MVMIQIISITHPIWYSKCHWVIPRKCYLATNAYLVLAHFLFTERLCGFQNQMLAIDANHFSPQSFCVNEIWFDEHESEFGLVKSQFPMFLYLNSQIWMVFRLEFEMVCTTGRVKYALRLWWHSIHSNGIQWLVYVHRNRLQKSLWCQSKESNWGK